MKCQNCNSTEIETDAARGVCICVSCGRVVQSQAIVSEVSFVNSSAAGYFLNSKTGQGALFAGSKYI